MLLMDICPVAYRSVQGDCRLKKSRRNLTRYASDVVPTLRPEKLGWRTWDAIWWTRVVRNAVFRLMHRLMVRPVLRQAPGSAPFRPWPSPRPPSCARERVRAAAQKSVGGLCLQRCVF